MVKVQNLTIKNFLSIGNATQAINLNRQDLVLVLGENLDLGGEDNGSRNGVGKTSLINALSYALYGSAISDIRKEHLINKSNGKNMLVTLDFELNSTSYRIVRGRKPNILEFYKNGIRQEGSAEDLAQGDSRETQHEIERLLGMSHDMFCQIVAINTYSTPFLFQKVNDQRTIIEQLLGITLLSEKAEQLKDEIKTAREHLTGEEARIRAVETANKRIQEQIDSLMLKQRAWINKKNTEIAALAKQIDQLSKIDIEQELAAHAAWADWQAAQRALQKLADEYNQLIKTQGRQQAAHHSLESNLALLEQQICHTCNQPLHSDKHQELVSGLESQLASSAEELTLLEQAKALLEKQIQDQPSPPKPSAPHYQELNHAHDHRNCLMLLEQQLSSKQQESDPYQEQIDSMQNSALETVDRTLLNELSRVVDHQEFLLKLLTNKDSFIRKKIIDQNLSYLNSRLSYYLEALGLPHEVIFQNDLSVTISELGRDLSPGNLSRGEMTRLSLGLSFSFRDVWEGLYHRINILMIDESMDNGLDSAGTENAVKLLRDMNREQDRDVWLISHKEEVRTKFTAICKVIKENGFTSFSLEE